jgi:hypothetical protein
MSTRPQWVSGAARASGTATGAGLLDDPDYVCRGASAARFVPSRFRALRAGERFHQVDLLTIWGVQQYTPVYRCIRRLFRRARSLGAPLATAQAKEETVWELLRLYKGWRFRRWERRYLAAMDDRFDIW